ncbi:MAG TPA: hypothetical protein VNX02_16805 [Steroidobacteraceae bacterium]|nr:hypothetical protein [Steroidobacteraceae bacterium]
MAANQSLVILKRDGGTAFLNELRKLASLGSAWASAFLGYQALLLRDDGARDIDAAIQLCKAPAASGDAYAAYILAWANHLRGDHAEAITHFRTATRQLFPPAVVDFAFVFWKFQSDKQPDGVLASLQVASSVGHCEALRFRCAIYRTGKLGFWRRVVGNVLTPIAYVNMLIPSLLHPFSAQVFRFNPKAPSKALSLRP